MCYVLRFLCPTSFGNFEFTMQNAHEKDILSSQSHSKPTQISKVALFVNIVNDF